MLGKVRGAKLLPYRIAELRAARRQRNARGPCSDTDSASSIAQNPSYFSARLEWNRHTLLNDVLTCVSCHFVLRAST